MGVLAFGIEPSIEWEVGIGDQAKRTTQSLGRQFLARLFQEIGEVFLSYCKRLAHLYCS
jgi:hypothetical protein